MPTTREILAQAAGILGSVPKLDNFGSVCRCCLGPVNEYEMCHACHMLFRNAGVPEVFQKCVVPITAAINPSPWYTRLQTYKTLQKEHGALIASLVYEYTMTHQGKIRSALGGDPSFITVVPSKRGVDFEHQPLRLALARVRPLADALVEAVRFKRTETLGRKEYKPSAFRASEKTTGKRVVLIEDTWVTGATALSSAGCLLEAGAESVLILPVARMVEASFWAKDHPYLVAMKRPFDPHDPDGWPRP